MFLIPWLAFFWLWAVLVRLWGGVRVAFLAAQVINGVLIVLATETLSAFKALALWPLAIFWMVVFLIEAILWKRLAGIPRVQPASVVSQEQSVDAYNKGTPVKDTGDFSPRQGIGFCNAFADTVRSLDAIEIIFLAGIGMIVAVTGIIALVAPPNNYDSMVYHMARVAHWASNATVVNYPTHTLSQLVIPPYNAYAILQGFILSGSDHLANWVQWDSLMASLVGVSLIAEMLGGSRRVQLFAVLLAVTFPMGILQASSTQNDYVATMWSVAVAVFALLLIKTGRPRWGILCALSFGLATFTKGTAVILGGPFLLWALWKVKWKVGPKLALGLLVIVTVGLLNAAFFHRLTELSPHPFEAMQLGGSAVVDKVDGRGMISNAVRGVATALALPSWGGDRFWAQGVAAIHHWLGIGANDPRFTSAGFRFLLWYPVPMQEDYATSWVHSIIYLLLVLYLVIILLKDFFLRVMRRDTVMTRPSGVDKKTGRWQQNNLFRQFVLVFIFSVFLFFALVKWQEFIARFHLPFFIMFSAAAGIVLASLSPRPWILGVVGGWMLAVSIAPLLWNPQRSIFPYGAVTRNRLEKTVSRGGEIFDWLMKNGYFQESSGPAGYLKVMTGRRWEQLRQAYPVEYGPVSSALRLAPSYSRGLFSTPREELLFGRFYKVTRDSLEYDVQITRHYLRQSSGCQDIGLMTGPITYEYPFWRLLNPAGPAVRLEHIGVDNASKKIPYPRGEPEPCLILKEADAGPETITFHGRKYLRRSQGPVLVYVDERLVKREVQNFP